MSYQVQADVEQMRATATAMRAFSELLHNNRKGLDDKIVGFISDFFRGNLQSMFETAITSFTPQVWQLSSTIDDLAQRLEQLAQRIEEADVLGANSVSNSSNGFSFTSNGMHFEYINPEFADTTINFDKEHLNKLLIFMAEYGQDNNPANVTVDKMGTFLNKLFNPNNREQIIQDYLARRYTDSDHAATALINSLLTTPPEGGDESIEFKLKANASIPVVKGLEVQGEQSYQITRNDDGTYTATVFTKAGAGAGVGASASYGSINMMDRDLTLGAEANAKLLQNISAQVSFKFDPNNPGDMTNMMLLTGALSTKPGLPMSPVSPMLSQLQDNFQSATLAPGVELNGTLAAGFSRAELGVTGDMPVSIERNDQGQFEVSRGLRISANGKLQLVDPMTNTDINASGNVSLATYAIQNISDGSQQAKVVALVEYDPNSNINFPEQLSEFVPYSNLEQYIPQPEHKTSYVVEYTLNQPFESVQSTIFNGNGINLQELIKNSSVEVNMSQSEMIDIGGSIAGAVGADASVARSSTRTILKGQPADVAPPQ